MLSDRFIPLRISSDAQSSLEKVNLPPNTTPHQKLLYNHLIGQNESRVLRFSYQPHVLEAAPSALMNFRQQHVLDEQTYKLKPVPFFLERGRAIGFEAPYFPQDFYSNRLACLPNGYIAMASPDDDGCTIFSVSIKTNEMFELTSVDGEQCSVVASFGNKIISGWDTGRIRMHELPAPGMSSNAIKVIDFTPDENWLSIAATGPNTFACGSRQGLLMFVDVREPPEASCSRAQRLSSDTPEAIIGLAHNDEYHLASGSADNKVRLWDVRVWGASQRALEPILINSRHSGAVKALQFHPEFKYKLVSGGGADCRRLCLWNTRTDSSLVYQTPSQVSGVQFLQDSSYIATSHGFSDSMIRTWRVSSSGFSLLTENRSTAPEIKEDTQGLLSLVRHEDTLVTLKEDETLRFFSVKEKSARPRRSNVNVPLVLQGESSREGMIIR